MSQLTLCCCWLVASVRDLTQGGLSPCCVQLASLRTLDLSGNRLGQKVPKLAAIGWLDWAANVTVRVRVPRREGRCVRQLTLESGVPTAEPRFNGQWLSPRPQPGHNAQPRVLGHCMERYQGAYQRRAPATSDGTLTHLPRVAVPADPVAPVASHGVGAAWRAQALDLSHNSLATFLSVRSISLNRKLSSVALIVRRSVASAASRCFCCLSLLLMLTCRRRAGCPPTGNPARGAASVPIAHAAPATCPEHARR